MTEPSSAPMTEAQDHAVSEILHAYNNPPPPRVRPRVGPDHDRVAIAFPDGRVVVVGPDGAIVADSRPPKEREKD